MKNNSTNTLSEKDLDNLLNQAFLDLDFTTPKNKEMIESIANYSLAGIPVSSVKINKSFFNKLLIIFAALSMVGTCAFLWNKNNNAPGNTSINVITIEKRKVDSIQAVQEEIVIKENKKIGKPYIDREKPLAEIVIPAIVEDTEEIAIKEIIYSQIIPTENKSKASSDYVFPKLTEKEIKANEKEKKRMGELAAKVSKKRYALIPGKKFYMQITEVTNLEYRTFLFDLLIQDKKEDFLKAKPDQSLWINSNGTNKFDGFKELYFSAKKFKDYPVVNISIEGAEMYCQWLSNLASSYLKHEAVKVSSCDYRLPTESEWVYAAKAGKSEATYPWGRDSIQNNKNRFMANFCIQKLKEKFNQPIVYPDKINLNAYTAAGMATNNDTMATAHVFSYNPNDYFLYCMSGNVSEMVYIDGTKIVKTKGGNWASDFEHLKINSEDEFKTPIKPSPKIGFRVVVNIEN